MAVPVCERCDLPRAPYGVAVPSEHAGSYCWGSSPVGIGYCLEHHGTRNEDEDGMCDWFDPLEHEVSRCRFVQLRYDHTEAPEAVQYESEDD